MSDGKDHRLRSRPDDASALGDAQGHSQGTTASSSRRASAKAGADSGKPPADLDIWLEAEDILAQMLHTATEPLAVDAILQRCLDLLLSTSWLRIEAKGGIFLVDADSRTLTLFVHRNLAQPLLRICARVPFGRCLCGRVAESREILHTSCVDDRHEHRYDGMKPHGHYVVPILAKKRLLGVLVLYLPHGYEPQGRELSFLRSAANIFAMIIQLRRYQEHLEDLVAERTAALEAEIARRRVQEEALRQAKEAAEAADRAKSALLANMSHEFKTPLNAIIGFADMLVQEMHGSLGDDRYRDYAATIVTSGQRLLSLLADLLELARAQDSGMTLEEDECDPIQLARHALERVQAREDWPAERAQIRLPADRRLPLLWVDRKRLARALDHLLDNAGKFSPPQSPITLAVSLDEETEELVFSVRDEGIGMDAETRERAGTLLWQKDAGLARVHEGAGMGLAYVRAVMRAHGGRLVIDSRPGAGTTVRLHFPPARLIREEDS